MRTTIKTIGENRLIFRKASDFSYTGPKLNSRNAKINAQNQATTRAESLLSQQKQAANVAKQNPLMYDGSTQTTPIEKPADTTYNIDFIETRGGALPFGGKIKSEQVADNGNREYILDNGTRVSASAYDTEAEKIFTQVADQQRIKDSLNPLTEIAQRGQQELNPTENMFNDAGVLDMAAVKRLRASGMSDSEIKKRINGLKPSIKETMSNTPNYSPTTTKQTGATQQGTDSTTNITPNKTLTVVSYVDNPDGTTTNTLSDGTKSTVRYTKNPDGSLTPSEVTPSTTPSTVATTNKTNADTTKMSLAQSVSNLVSSTYGDDPMGQFMQAKLQGDLDLYIDGLVGAAIAKDEEISSAEIQGAAYQKLLDSFYSAHKENNDNLKGILTNVKNDNLKYLEEQKQRDIDKLEWQKQEQVRQGEKQKTQQLLQQSISQALGGRAFSGAGNEQIAATERELDNAIANLAKEYDFKSADIGAQYTQKYTDVNNQFRMDIFNAATQLDQQIETYSLNSFANKKSITDAINKAKGDYAKNVSEIKSGYQKGLSDMVKDSMGAIKDKKAEINQRKQDEQKMAFSMFTDAFNNSTDPVYRTEALNMMRKAGYNLDGMDINNMTLEQQLKVVDIMKKQTEMQGSRPDNYEGEERSIMEGALAVAQKVGGSDDYKQSIISTIKRYVDEGDIEGARERMEKYAASSLSGDEGKQYNIMTLAAESSSQLIDDLNAMVEDGTLRGKWVTKWNQVKNAANTSKNPKYVNISARIAAIASNELNRLSGAAISPEEYKRLTEFIPAANDTVLDAKNKLVEFEKLMKNYRSQTLSRLTGLDRPSTTSQNSSTVQGGYDINYFDNLHGFPKTIIDSGGGAELSYVDMGKETQGFNTPIASREDGGLYDVSTVEAWGGKHAGLDIAMKVGTPLPALSNMEVVAVADTKGWGKTVILKDQNGAEHRLSHLSNINVRKGDTVKKGQVIALSGNTGNSTGPHLDYRIRLDNKYIDPSSYNIS